MPPKRRLLLPSPACPQLTRQRASAAPSASSRPATAAALTADALPRNQQTSHGSSRQHRRLWRAPRAPQSRRRSAARPRCAAASSPWACMPRPPPPCRSSSHGAAVWQSASWAAPASVAATRTLRARRRCAARACRPPDSSHRQDCRPSAASSRCAAAWQGRVQTASRRACMPWTLPWLRFEMPTHTCRESSSAACRRHRCQASSSSVACSPQLAAMAWQAAGVACHGRQRTTRAPAACLTLRPWICRSSSRQQPLADQGGEHTDSDVL